MSVSDPDGDLMDITFRTDDLVGTLMLDDQPVGVIVPLALIGELENGCEFIAFDGVRIVGHGTGGAFLTVQGTYSGAGFTGAPGNRRGPDVAAE